MNAPSVFTPGQRDPNVDQIIKLAVMAVGGQGGGVLAGWIEQCARMNGYAVQATSVAGVAQRTGATIYYIEMAQAGDRQPVFSLMPAAGDVDILVAAELMEAGRAILRGFVTPDRTTLIASSHRTLAVSEKTVPGDGIADRSEVIAAAEIAARRFIKADLDSLAANEGSVISASLFGALAGSGALPFKRDTFEDAIKASKRGADASLRAFARGFAVGAGKDEVEADGAPVAKPHEPDGPSHLLAHWEQLSARASALPDPVTDMAHAGLRKVVDFLDLDYGAEYIERLEAIVARDSSTRNYILGVEAAKHLANAMAYDDVIRVADRKTRAARFERIRGEMAVGQSQQMVLTEFMHPRAEEICGMMPVRLGRAVEARPWATRLIDRLFNKGRRIQSTRLRSFLQLYLIGGLQRYRRRTLRHAIERQHMEASLQRALAHLDDDYDLAVELIRNRRLIKGYSDTHSRGLSKFDKVMDAGDALAGRKDAAQWVGRLREAALQDEEGKALDGALKTVRSFTE